jgi:hypothetical protein
MLESIERFDVDGGVKQKIRGANAGRLLGL